MIDITICNAEGAPEATYLSMRVGELRRQMALKDGSKFRFEAASPPKAFTLDVFQKVGTAQVALDELAELDQNSQGNASQSRKGSIEVALTGGSSLKVGLQVDAYGEGTILPALSEDGSDPKASLRQVVAEKAKSYLDGHAVQKVLQGMVHSLLETQPEEPLAFMVTYLQDAQAEAEGKTPLGSEREEGSSRMAKSVSVVEPQATDYHEEEGDEEDHEVADGLGDSEYPGFPADECPEELPDLSDHHSIVIQVLRDHPEIYHKLRHKTTKLGVPLAKIIKTAIDNPGHPFFQSVGIVAGDAESYEVFRELFDPVIKVRHGEDVLRGRHYTDLDASKVSKAVIDPEGHRVQGVRVRTCRNYSGIRFLPACSKEERREVERIATSALLSKEAEEDLRGTYYAHRGSCSFEAQPDGMSMEQEAQLRKEGFIFDEPDAEVLLSSGFGRHWPDARGIFLSSDHRLFVFVNEEDHLRLEVAQPGQDLRGAFTRFCRLHAALESSARKEGHDFARSERFGFLGTDPSALGTCLTLSVTLRVPNLNGHGMELNTLCERLGVQARTNYGQGTVRKSREGIFDITTSDRLGSSEVDQVNLLIEACRLLVVLEGRLDRGETVDLSAEPAWAPAPSRASRVVKPAKAEPEATLAKGEDADNSSATAAS